MLSSGVVILTSGGELPAIAGQKLSGFITGIVREWANYEDSYIFINLFGPHVISMLDSSLKR